MKQFRWEKDGYVLRPAVKEDAEEYYSGNFNPLDPQTAYLTGCKPHFTRNEVIDFFTQSIDADDRYDFLIIDPDGHIIGESVLNEIDSHIKCANFRIALFHSNQYGKGLGSWVIGKTLQFAFEEIGLHRVSLDVFSFNHRAIRAYEKAGFKHEGVLRDAGIYGGQYYDDVLMAILENEWRQLHT